MRSLVISRWGPGRLDSGAALRNAQNMAALAGLGTVNVITVDPSGNIPDAERFPGVTETGQYVPASPWRVPGRWLLPGPHHTIRRYTDAALMQYLRSLTPDSYDFALIEEISLSAYVVPLRAAGIPTIFDAHNVEARLWADIGNEDGVRKFGLAALRQRMFNSKLRQAEARAVKTADFVWACSDVDARLMERLYQPKNGVAVVPNAINVDAYADARRIRNDADPTNPPLLVYIGSYSYKPNEIAALRLIQGILPALQQVGMDLNLAIVGRDPTLAMQKAAAKDRSVLVTGGVASILPYLAQQSIAVMPITIGGGTRLKVLEAFAAGCPVISTAKGAEGIDVQHGENILIAETDTEFVSEILRLVHDPAARATLGMCGFETVSRGYSWAAAARAVRASLGEATA
ncbi:glycosyltransferase involved in cell wall biosynthesis [Roseovarius sp. MBR-51]